MKKYFWISGLIIILSIFLVAWNPISLDFKADNPTPEPFDFPCGNEVNCPINEQGGMSGLWIEALVNATDLEEEVILQRVEAGESYYDIALAEGLDEEQLNVLFNSVHESHWEYMDTEGWPHHGGMMQQYFDNESSTNGPGFMHGWMWNDSDDLPETSFPRNFSGGCRGHWSNDQD
ncbi:MAG: hypothetical protein JEZ06_12735 [Anaerolineaceae bacterium]|nr:hypothetical protein [Anaerolineaceae bacterium]